MTRVSPERTGTLRKAGWFAVVLAAGAAVALASCRQQPAGELPALGTNLAETSVSGISSGAYMAGQFQLANGEIVVGAGIVAGGPYGCAESAFADVLPGPGASFLNATKAINGCMLNAMQMWGVPNPEFLAEKAAERAAAGRIAAIASVTSDRVYLFTGREDRTVVPAIVQAAAKFYQALGVPQQNIRLVATLDAGHAFVTETEGAACDVTGKPYIVDCDYDQAGDLLSFIHGPLTPRSAAPTGTFVPFDQRPFMRDLPNNGMADEGIVYVPRACQGAGGERDDAAGRCRVHVAFHGCAQNMMMTGDAFIRHTGFARWADTNRFVILFPQTSTNAFNPQGCWDWWGYTGRSYLTREAPQIVAVRRMLERLAAVPRPS